MERTSLSDFGSRDHFRNIRWLKDHWSRPDGPRTYYWYLTFERFPDLRTLVEECQEALAFPYYDLTALTGLHLTLDRIGLEEAITQDQLDTMTATATRACRTISPFDIDIGFLGGTPGAIGFSAYPYESLRPLRDILRGTTLSVDTNAPVDYSEFHPHVTIAYANSDGIPATEAIAAVEKIHATVSVTIADAALVLLERRAHSYTWRVVSRIPLAG